MRHLPVIFTVLTVCAGCSEDGISAGLRVPTGPLPDIVVEPPALLFGILSSEDSEAQTFTVRNEGDAPLMVEEVAVASGFAFELMAEDTSFELAAGEERTIPVQFSPVGTNENFGLVTVLSNDWDTPDLGVDLLGNGALPELLIEPDNFVFGDEAVPCGSEVELTLSNVGSEQLVIDDFDYSSAGLLELDASSVALPLTLNPGEARTVSVDFRPVARGSDTGRLDVYSNDPRGVLSAYQNGEGFSGEPFEEVFTEPGVAAVDVMVLIDHSCSMASDNQDDVDQGLPLFVNELRDVADWQLIQVTKEDGCSNVGILTPDVKDADQQLIDHAWDRSASAVSRTEMLLDLASTALDQASPGGCNEGFLRAGALLHVITISDEKEQSGRDHQHWLDLYASHLPSSDFLTVSAVADINFACGDGTGATGYLEAAQATGGSVLDICEPSWGSSFGDIASEVLAGVRTYNLTHPASDGSLAVYVNDVLTTDVSYVPATASVTIHSPAVGEGDMVRVSYVIGEEC